LILLAIIMPEISGYEVIKEPKSNDASAFPGDSWTSDCIEMLYKSAQLPDIGQGGRLLPP